MCRKSICLVCFGLAIGLSASVAVGGVSYLDPVGGWTYIYIGEQAAYDDSAPTDESLDGWWGHNDLSGGDSDSWDGSPIGSGNFGGVMSITEGGVTFLRIQDTGDPRDHAPSPGDPSNRKLMFTHELARDGIDPAATILDDGVTISFRARVATTPPLDGLYGDGGSPTGPWPAGGDGYAVHHEGKGNFGIRQNTGDAVVSFCLVLAGDAHATKIPAGRQGLCMNNLNGTSPSGDVDIEGNDAGTLNLLDIADPTRWHEFWIHIVADTSGGGTHQVTIWMDGNTTAPDGTFHVTAGNGNDEDYSYLEMGCGSTSQYGAFDADFFAYKPGLIPPVPSNPNLASVVNPAPGAIVGIDEAAPLEWLPGQSANFHDVYFGTDKADVNDADVSDTTGIYQGRQSAAIYVPSEALEFGRTYYWRIDEVEADNVTIHKGDVWSFTIRDYLIVDDFEDYNDFPPERIFDTWPGGLTSGDPANGSVVGNLVPPFAERTFVHSGSQALVITYDNSGPANFSEAIANIDDLKSGRDWTKYGVRVLSLWFRGYPEYVGSFVEAPAGTFTMTAGGADIAGASDQFHFAFKEVSGASAVVAKVLSVSNTHSDAKAGVMIRDTLDADSAAAMVYMTPGGTIALGYRNSAGDSASAVGQVSGIAAPQWVKIERTLGGLIRGHYSADGQTWTQLDTVSTVTMNTPMYVGLALTSHNVNETCVAEFSDVSFPNTSVAAQWAHQDIGIISNEAEPMYVAISDGSGTTGIEYYGEGDPDPNGTLINTYTEWPIDLKKFSDQNVNLADVDKMIIGFGNRQNPQPGGTGTMYFDDIRLYPPKCVLDKLVGLEADLTDDCRVDFADLQIMVNDWLQGDYTVPTAVPKDANLVLYYQFENNTVDSSGNAINGTPVGSLGYASGVFGQAIALNGSNYVNCGNPALLNFGQGDWSICAWVKNAQADDTATVFANGGDESGGIRYTLGIGEGGPDGVVTITTDDDATKVQAISATTVNDNEWHHVCTLRKASELQVYVDGILDATNTVPAGYDLSGTSQHNAYVGAITDHRDATGNTLEKFYTGLMDDLRIYDYALSDAELSYLATKGTSGLYFPLESVANLYDAEPQNEKKINFRDLAILAGQWLEEQLWPQP